MNEYDDEQLEQTLRTVEAHMTKDVHGTKGAKPPLVRALIQALLDGEALLFHD